MSAPLVSVIICVRNGEKYLEQALNGVATQGFADIELLVIDDGSTDDTAALAKRHSLRPDVLCLSPSGESAARNEGLKRAGGRFIAFLDHDDVWPPGRLRSLIAGFDQEPTPDFVFGKIVNTDADLVPIGGPAAARLVTAGLIRRAAAEAVGPFRTDITHGAQIDWVSRASAMLLFSVVDELVLLRRVHGGNMGIVGRGLARQEMLRVVRDHHARRNK